MARGILAVLSIALTVFALADCVQTQDDKVRGCLLYTSPSPRD